MRKKQLILDYQLTFGSEHGKRVLADLRRKCPLMDDSINVHQGVDTNKLLFLEGQRSVLLWIYKMMDTDPYEEKQRRATKNDNLQTMSLAT